VKLSSVTVEKSSPRFADSESDAVRPLSKAIAFPPGVKIAKPVLTPSGVTVLPPIPTVPDPRMPARADAVKEKFVSNTWPLAAVVFNANKKPDVFRLVNGVT
jgi:hypothetical protein